MDLVGSVVAVTGGAHGIGRALSERVAREGAAAVAVLDIDLPAAREVADAIGGLALGLDVTNEAPTLEAGDRVEAELGRLDLFCANAGIADVGGVELPDAEWRRMIDVNLMSHVIAARVLVPRMIARGGGHLLHTASAAGLLTQIGSAPYSVTKHGVIALAEWLAITHGDEGLGVSVLCPQGVRTAMTAAFDGGGVAGGDGLMEPEAGADAAIAGLPGGRVLILPHPEVAAYEQRRAADHDRWIAGMRRLQARYGGIGTPVDP